MSISRWDEDYETNTYILEANRKNELLIADLENKRTVFAGIGTNKAKRRLNKLALTDLCAKAIRLALEIEDKSISAKKSYGKYRDKIYYQKTQLILNLCQLFKEQNWIYGTQISEVPPTSHVIYFEIPGCEQISWHFTIEKSFGEFPEYTDKWDGKQNSTLDKLEKVVIKLLQK